MSLVRQSFGLCCPKCRVADHLMVQITTMARLHADGTEAVGDHHWSQDSACGCTECDHWATVDAFAVRKGSKR